MRISDLKNKFRIEMIETTQGCPEACLHCGAYDNFSTENLTLKQKPIIELENTLTNPIGYENLRLVDFLNRYITTYVNSEPLRTNNFTDFARLIYKLTRGETQVLALSHGVRAGSKEMKARLKEIVELMKHKIIPMFVLTIDSARNKGLIHPKINLESYRESLELLKPALNYGRVTISLQGQHCHKQLSIENTKLLFMQLINETNLDNRFVIDERSYTKAGRAAELSSSISEDCDVIPDINFVRYFYPNAHKWRGMIDFEGNLLIQPNRPGKTYGDSVQKELWKEITTTPFTDTMARKSKKLQQPGQIKTAIPESLHTR